MVFYTNEPYKIYYVAKDFKEGLTDVIMVVYLPDKSYQGYFNLIELNSTIFGKGIYYYEYTPVTEGEYLFVVDSLTNLKRDAKSATFINRVEKRPVAKFN